MNVEPNDLVMFAHVVDDGSLSRAAQRLGVPKSTVSRRLTALETQLGERLLLRTTRKLTVTDFGQAVLEHARHAAEDVQAASALAQHRQVQPSGRLRVTMPADLANLMLPELLAEFTLKHPAITLELDLSSRIVDLVAENFDVAIRMGALRDDATLAARRLASLTSGLYAAPSYVRRRGTPTHPDDLMRHDALHVMGRTGEPMPWVLRRRGEHWEGTPTARVIANSPEAMMRMALHGAGITFAHDFFALPHVERGELVPVLPDWRFAPVIAWAVFPGRRLMPARARVFIDMLAAKFDDSQCAPLVADMERRRERAATKAGAKRDAARVPKEEEKKP